MTRFKAAIVLAGLAAAATIPGLQFLKPAGGPEPVAVEVTAGPLQVCSTYEGYLESRSVRQVMSQLAPATIVELASDGSRIREGDLLVRFDSSQLERDLLRLERDYAMAKAEMETLSAAKLPLELRELEMREAESRARYAEELQTLKDSQELVKDQLISEHEIKQQEVKVEAAKAQTEYLKEQLELTRKYVHPAALERAKAALASAEQELAWARRQMSNCLIRAASEGILSYKALSVGGEFRTVRVGDMVYRNQPFMVVSDMSNLVMYCDIPEADLALVRVGAGASIRPLSYADISIDGRVEYIGAAARTLPGRSQAQKYFNVTVRLEGGDERLRSGMTATARVLSYANPKATLVPRSAVWWENDCAWCNVQRGARAEKTKLVTGAADATRYEVIEGVRTGDRILTRQTDVVP